MNILHQSKNNIKGKKDMIVKTPIHFSFKPDEYKRLRDLANKGKLKITKSYLSKIINEKVSIPRETYDYLESKIRYY